VKCNFRLNCILKQELRCCDLRSKSLKKPPFRPQFQAVLPLSGPLISAESGSGHPPSRTRETWLAPNVHLATVLPPHAPRPTLHDARPAGPGREQTLPRLATAWHRPPDWQRPSGARSRRSASLYSVCHRIGRSTRADQTFMGDCQLARHDGWQAAIFGGRKRPSLLVVAHHLASATELFSPLAAPRPLSILTW